VRDSSDRANAARRILVQEGLPSPRITEVIGLADRKLKYPDDPLNPANRRISIRLPFVTPTGPIPGDAPLALVPSGRGGIGTASPLGSGSD
jgi:hypothetical protein